MSKDKTLLELQNVKGKTASSPGQGQLISVLYVCALTHKVSAGDHKLYHNEITKQK